MTGYFSFGCCFFFAVVVVVVVVSFIYFGHFCTSIESHWNRHSVALFV